MRDTRRFPFFVVILSVTLPVTLSILSACSGSDAGIASENIEDAADGLVNDTVEAMGDTDGPAEEAWRTWYEPGVEKRGPFTVLRLKGTPYEMGVQHATLMEEQLKKGVEYLESSYLGLLEPMAKEFGFLDEAYEQSYQAILDECRGMADVLGDQGWTFDRCLSLAYGDVVIEHLNNGSLRCTQFVATGAATPGGVMVHARNLDWDRIEYMLDYPTIIVRHPEGRIPYVTVGFPGMVAPYNGMNAAGVTIASDEADTTNDYDRVGRSHVQMEEEVLSTTTSLEEARAFIEAQDHMTAEIFMVADGDHDAAAVFEMTANHMAVRELSSKGIVYTTNHFLDESMVPFNVSYDPQASTTSRLKRLRQLVEPDGIDSMYGAFDPEAAIRVLRDNVNPHTGQEMTWEGFDVDVAIGHNGNVYSMVFVPAKREMYVAAGSVPVPLNPYIGFSLDELFGKPGSGSPPTLDPNGHFTLN